MNIVLLSNYIYLAARRVLYLLLFVHAKLIESDRL